MSYSLPNVKFVFITNLLSPGIGPFEVTALHTTSMLMLHVCESCEQQAFPAPEYNKLTRRLVSIFYNISQLLITSDFKPRETYSRIKFSNNSPTVSVQCLLPPLSYPK